ncbi:MAG: hypothetical protein ACXVZX_11440 [Terriglobales bacterium]
MFLDRHTLLAIAVTLIVFILAIVISPVVDLPAAATRALANILLVFACIITAAAHRVGRTFIELVSSRIPLLPIFGPPQITAVLLC